MKYVCFRCNIVKEKSEEKAFVYADSVKNVKVLVCKTCHQANVHNMHEEAEKHLGQRVHLGVLRGSPKPISSE